LSRGYTHAEQGANEGCDGAMIVLHEGVERAHVTGIHWRVVLLVIVADGGRIGLAAVPGDCLRPAMTAGMGAGG
jgi:hypothetical protein